VLPAQHGLLVRQHLQQQQKDKKSNLSTLLGDTVAVSNFARFVGLEMLSGAEAKPLVLHDEECEIAP
jgi:hypothetical protein